MKWRPRAEPTLWRKVTPVGAPFSPFTPFTPFSPFSHPGKHKLLFFLNGKLDVGVEKLGRLGGKDGGF